MASQREKEATDYLKKHNIIELMNELTTKLFFHRPENPREFLIDQLEQLKASKQKSLFDDSNMDAVFGMLARPNQEHITYAQYKHALTTLGITDISEYPEGVNEDRISRETFKRDAREGLQK
ncbi:EF-hand calcium-binding domain-containing protein 10 [Diretmus argenteus]